MSKTGTCKNCGRLYDRDIWLPSDPAAMDLLAAKLKKMVHEETFLNFCPGCRTKIGDKAWNELKEGQCSEE